MEAASYILGWPLSPPVRSAEWCNTAAPVASSAVSTAGELLYLYVFNLSRPEKRKSLPIFAQNSDLIYYDLPSLLNLYSLQSYATFFKRPRLFDNLIRWKLHCWKPILRCIKIRYNFGGVFYQSKDINESIFFFFNSATPQCAAFLANILLYIQNFV